MQVYYTILTVLYVIFAVVITLFVLINTIKSKKASEKIIGGLALVMLILRIFFIK